MKKINLNDVIGNISDELIERSLETDSIDKLNELIKIDKKKKKLFVLRYIKYASCFIFILFTTMLIFNKREETVLIPNPIEEVSSLTELSRYLDINLDYLNFKEIDTIIIYNNEYLGQINFKDNSTLRIGKSCNDVSGIYNSKFIKDITINNINVKIYQINDKEYASFTYNDYSYSYVKEQNEDINKIIEIIIKGE